MPTVAFTQTEVEHVRRIVRMGTSVGENEELTEKLAALNDGQATTTREDIIAWNRIKYGTTKVKGGIKGTNYDMERERLFITNEMRLRLNYPLIASAADPDEIAMVSISTRGWVGPSSASVDDVAAGD